MERYQNVNGNSAVIGFEIGAEYISVQFKETSRIYVYSYGKAGKIHVDAMKGLARQGYGLGSYINKNVKFLYD